jgi:exodeoxyribonuclease VII small subunit
MVEQVGDAEPGADAAADVGVEELLAQIDAILARMEAPDAPLETLIRDFEAGMLLMRRAQGLLSDAEQRVEMLLGDPPDGLDGETAPDGD